MEGLFGLLLATLPPIFSDRPLPHHAVQPSPSWFSGVDDHHRGSILHFSGVKTSFDPHVRCFGDAVLDGKWRSGKGIDSELIGGSAKSSYRRLLSFGYADDSVARGFPAASSTGSEAGKYNHVFPISRPLLQRTLVSFVNAPPTPKWLTG